jgi:hypothetical protein
LYTGKEPLDLDGMQLDENAYVPPPIDMDEVIEPEMGDAGA